jgi:hypothetical protein
MSMLGILSPVFTLSIQKDLFLVVAWSEILKEDATFSDG